jgi:acid stress-induced BolA-like protein IbaG/YrbA
VALKQKLMMKEKLLTLLEAPESGIRSPVLDVEKRPNGTVGGFLISPTFFGMPQLDRQNMVWDYLDAHLSKADVRKIFPLIAATAAEMGEEFEEEWNRKFARPRKARKVAAA